MFEAKKSGKVYGVELSADELSEINKLTLEPLDAESVFAFKVVACGNEVDRDGEAFTTNALNKLAELFVGKTMIMDHNPTAENQLARVYRAEVVPCNDTTKTGEPHAQLVVYCYMVKTDSKKDIITEIKAGIKKEVSVGCAVSTATCSICGTNKVKGWCEHRALKAYEGKTCYVQLDNPTDAYELSFVAIPAQPEAGVTKNYGGKPNPPEPKTIAEKLIALHKRKDK